MNIYIIYYSGIISISLTLHTAMFVIDNPIRMMLPNIPTLPPKPSKVKPGPFDVICARGKQAYNHDGVSSYHDNHLFHMTICILETKLYW